MKINHYQLGELLHESTNSLVYRAQGAEGQPVVVKMLKEPYREPERLAWFRREYETTQRLELAGVVQAYELIEGERCLMVLEDFGGESLSRLKLGGSLEITYFLRLVLQVAEILGQIHQQQVIHKDINPSNILLNPTTGVLKLIDFGISTRLSQENASFASPTLLQGTLPYISPEQTGRMNRAVDYRADFYSLGVTSYQLLTGQLPFVSSDALEMVHSHIAKNPLAPHELKPELPLALSKIIMKLLAKGAEERYQTAYGLMSDLERCLREMEERGTIEPFALGEQDISANLQIPQRLYGRKGEVKRLLAAFERVSQGQREMLLVSGDAGVGKSALVQELYKPLTACDGYFVRGKFDQFQRNMPYSALTQAFEALMRQLLAEDESRLRQWRAKILAAVGNNGQVLIDLIPSLELVIGKQPPVAQVGSQEALNRFNLLIQRFIKAISSAQHPLVLFIDDLQWADGGSLNLLKLLMNDEENQYLLLIGAYRDNEDGAEPLMMALEAIKQGQGTLSLIHLQNLVQQDVNALISDSLACAASVSEPLSELIYAKTEGNAFFTLEFLKSLAAEKLLRFVPARQRWEWERAEILAKASTDNVVALMADKLTHLPPQTQALLEVAACIGSQFDWQTLARVAAERLPLASEAELLEALWAALQEGLIVPRDESYKLLLTRPLAHSSTRPLAHFSFQHDRVQQAAYLQLAEAARQATHLAIGRLLLAHSSPSQLNEHIFKIVNQLNQGAALVSERAEARKLARLNLQAGQKAKASAAYQPALAYFQQAITLLGEAAWAEAYELSLLLHQESAEVAYLSGEFAQAGRLIELTLHHAQSILDKIKTFETQILFYGAQYQLQAAVDTGLAVLPQLGVSLSQAPPQGIEIEALYHLPEMTAPDKLAAMRILMRIAPPAFIVNPMLYSQLIFTMVDLCMRHGNSRFAPFPYVSYGVILCGFMGNIDLGYQMGRLAQRLVDKLEAKELQCKVETLFNVFIRSWKEHSSESIEALQEAVQIGLETGDLEFTAYAALNVGMKMLLSGMPLESVLAQHEPYIALLQKLKQEYQLVYAQIWQQFELNLSHEAENGAQLIGSALNEAQMRPIFEQTHNMTSLFALYLAKSRLSYLLKDAQSAVENAQAAAPYSQAGMGLLEFAQYNFYMSLSLLAAYPKMEESQQHDALNKLSAHQEQMKSWATHAPMNFAHKYQLVEAERARIRGQPWQASQRYEQAIALAKTNGYLQEEALAYELAAQFYLAEGMKEIAQSYLSKALVGYQRRQNRLKVKQLQADYPELLLQSSPSASLSTSNTITSTQVGMTLDFASLMKASQAISSEIALERLLAQMMRIMLENAGAERGLFLHADGEQWRIEAEASSESQTVHLLAPIRLAQANQTHNTRLSKGIVNYVIRTQETLVLNNAITEGPFTRDPYVATYQPNSILCMPLLNQGNLVGVIYLENNLTSHAFTPKRVELMQLLGSQAAISISNAQAIALRAQQAQLRMEKEVAERASQAKSDFLSNMSHELRTPLNGILGYAQILQRNKNLVDEQKKGLEIIYQSGQHLLTLINDILDLSKIEARKMELYPAPLHLPNFLGGIAGLMRMRAEEKDILLRYEPNEALPTGIMADEKRLRQILLNLLGNAVKFTQRGSVTLKVLRRDNSQKAASASRLPQTIKLRFEVSDTGVGMSVDAQQKIFQPFEQVGEAKQRAKGTGLGLAISKELIELMGGNIEVESQLGQGSTFSFEIEVAPASADAPTQQKEWATIVGYKGRKRHILIADDKVGNQQVLYNMLKPLGFAITISNNGQEALQKARQSKPDIILMDLVMPVMTGFEAAQAIRQVAELAKIPIIAISASVFQIEQEDSKFAGCDAFLSKPVSLSKLLPLFQQYLQLEWHYQEATPAQTAAEKEETAAPVVAPPIAQLEILYELAMLGKMRRIRKEAKQLEALDQQYIPFAQKVYDLAKRIKRKEILELLKGMMT